MPHETDTVPSDPTAFGPTPDDIQGYLELLAHREASGDQDPGFRPGTNAELTFKRIDERSLGSFISQQEAKAGALEQTRLKIAHQRYIAGALGLRVMPSQFDASSYICSAEVALPNKANLPPQPRRDSSLDAFVDPRTGRTLSNVRADATFAAHLIANNHARFSEPHVFERLCLNTIQQAASGRLEVSVSDVNNRQGELSLVRQTARLLGYTTGQPQTGTNGTLTLPITGVDDRIYEKVSSYKTNDYQVIPGYLEQVGLKPDSQKDT